MHNCNKQSILLRRFRLFRKTNQTRLMAAAATALLMGGCATDDLDLAVSGADDAVMVSAYVQAPENTRADLQRPYVEEGALKGGTYYMLYRKPTTSSYTYYLNAKVDFGDTEGPTTGYVYIIDGDTRKDLKWRSVYQEGGTNSTFYLSNISPDQYTLYGTYGSTSYYGHFRLYGKTGNPFVAGPLDREYGTNDIISGSVVASRTTQGKLEFPMAHRLSLLTVNVEVYGAKTDNHKVVLDNAEVWIDNVASTARTFQITSPSTWSYST